MTILRRILDLGGNDRTLLLAAVPVVAVVRLGLWIASFGTVRRVSEAVAARVASAESDPSIKPARIVWLTGLACRLVPGAHCLTRSMAAQFFLSRHGYPTSVRIGVRKDDGQLEAHAWLEHNGKPLFEDIAHIDRFTPLSPSSIEHEAFRTIK